MAYQHVPISDLSTLEKFPRPLYNCRVLRALDEGLCYNCAASWAQIVQIVDSLPKDARLSQSTALIQSLDAVANNKKLFEAVENTDLQSSSESAQPKSVR